MKISVVIPTLNRAESLRKVFEDLRRQSYKDFEVVVLDGGSIDNTEEICQQYQTYFILSFHRQKSPGIVAAMNESLDYCTGDVFTRTDDDVALSENWLQEIVAVFKECPQAGGVTGPTIIPQDRRESRDLILFNVKIAAAKGLFWKLFRVIYYDYFMEGKPFAVSRFFKCGAFSLGSNYEESKTIKGITEVDYLESCNWSMRMELIHKVGGFDQRYGGLSEYFEADAVYRIKNLKYKMYFNPKSWIKHLVDKGGNFKARSGTFGRAQNFILFYYRNIKPNTPDKILRFLAYLLFINLYFVYCFIKSRNIRQLSGIAGTLTALLKYLPEIFK
jgi:glycosyltransferase involved in cell wall biosynthesis